MKDLKILLNNELLYLNFNFDRNIMRMLEHTSNKIKSIKPNNIYEKYEIYKTVIYLENMRVKIIKIKRDINNLLKNKDLSKNINYMNSSILFNDQIDINNVMKSLNNIIKTLDPDKKTLEEFEDVKRKLYNFNERSLNMENSTYYEKLIKKLTDEIADLRIKNANLLEELNKKIVNEKG